MLLIGVFNSYYAYAYAYAYAYYNQAPFFADHILKITGNRAVNQICICSMISFQNRCENENEKRHE